MGSFVHSFVRSFVLSLVRSSHLFSSCIGEPRFFPNIGLDHPATQPSTPLAIFHHLADPHEVSALLALAVSIKKLRFESAAHEPSRVPLAQIFKTKRCVAPAVLLPLPPPTRPNSPLSRPESIANRPASIAHDTHCSNSFTQAPQSSRIGRALPFMGHYSNSPLTLRSHHESTELYRPPDFATTAIAAKRPRHLPYPECGTLAAQSSVCSSSQSNGNSMLPGKHNFSFGYSSSDGFFSSSRFLDQGLFAAASNNLSPQERHNPASVAVASHIPPAAA